jgi:hypothetical protein
MSHAAADFYPKWRLATGKAMSLPNSGRSRPSTTGRRACGTVPRRRIKIFDRGRRFTRFVKRLCMHMPEKIRLAMQILRDWRGGGAARCGSGVAFLGAVTHQAVGLLRPSVVRGRISGAAPHRARHLRSHERPRRLVGALFPVTTFAYKGKPVIKVPAS